MSTQLIVDPEEVVRFARELKAYNEYLRSNTARLRAKLNQLGSTWRDQEHQKFTQEFEQAIRPINQFLGNSDSYVGFLNRKAEAARIYMRQR